MLQLQEIWLDFQVWHSKNFIYNRIHPDVVPVDQIITIATAICFAIISLYQHKVYWKYSKSIRITTSIVAVSYLISSVFYNWLFTLWRAKEVSDYGAMDFNFTFVTLDATVIMLSLLIHFKTRTEIKPATKALLWCMLVSSSIALTHEYLVQNQIYWVKLPIKHHSGAEYLPFYAFTLIPFMYYVLNSYMIYLMLRKKP